MKRSPDNSILNRIKKWLFEYITTIDLTRPTNTYFLLLMSLLQLGVLPFFYYHPHYSFQKNFPLIVQYIALQEKYFMHMAPFSNNILTLVTLSIYPFVMVLVLVIKWLGQIRILVIVVQLAIFLMPFLLIKIVLQTAICMLSGGVMLAGLLLSLVSLAFGTIVFLLLGKIHRFIQIPIILSLSLGGNQYVIISMLGLRLLILAYLQYSTRISSILSICFQTALYLQLLSLLFCSSELLNYISFSLLIACCLVFGLYQANLELNRSKNIYDYLEAMEEEEGSEFEVLRIVEQHETACTFVTCNCHSYLQWDLKQLKAWVYKYEQERLKKKNSFRQRLQYAQICTERYDFKLNGLIRVYQAHPNSLEEEYQILKTCQIYQNNLRKQDKNYKHGEVYLNINEEQQLLSQNLSKIINMIKEFWNLIANFDGSTKFLTLILNISQAIAHLQASYQHLFIKYDQDLVNLKYLMDLFRTIVLNEKINEEDQIIFPQPITFLISSGNTILKANNNFSLLVNRPLDQLIGSSYLPFIPECYREPHNKWTEQFVEKVGQYQDKKLEKSFANDEFEIQQVLMQHRVLPRFMQGLEIFTTIQSSIQSDSFVAIVEKDTLCIKNIETSFYQLTKFRYNQRNIKQLKQMSVPAIFQNINLSPSTTPQQTILTTFFIEEHTHLKKIINNQKRTGRRSLTGSGGYSRNGTGTIKMKIDEDDALFYYEALPNSHEDPYIKIRFTPKNKRQIKIVDDDQSNSRLEKASELQQSIRGKQQKSQDFHLPVYMLLLFVVIHIVAISMFAVFKEGLTVVENRYKFYVAYDQTILYSKNITVGSNQVHNLQSLWIHGYGDYSESINAFLWVSDPHFGVYVNSTVSVDFHNSIFVQIEDNNQDILKKVQLLKLLLVAIFSSASAFYLLDFILSLRYIFKIERKVGELLLHFILMDQDDIQLLDDTLDNFLINILNQMQKRPKPQKIPLQTAQQSAMELLRGSPNNYGLNYQDGDSIVERKSTYRRHSSSFFGDSEKMSLSQIKLDFIEYSQPDNSKRRKSKLDSINFDQQAIRQQNILHFQQQYGSCEFVLRTNSRLFLLIVIGLLLVCSLIIATFFLLYIPANDYSARLHVLSGLYKSKIILYKSLTEIALSNFSLYPLETFSQQLLEIEEYLSKLKSNEHDQFRKQLNTSLRGDVCSVFNSSSVCGSTSSISTFGLTVMAQQIQEYFRLRDNQAIIVSNTQNTLISYSESLLEYLISTYILANTNMDNNLSFLEIQCVVFGTIAAALSLLLSWYSLRQFRNRIEDSKSLLKIIPRQIRSRHELGGQKLDQNELE